jgi:cell division protein FtsA
VLSHPHRILLNAQKGQAGVHDIVLQSIASSEAVLTNEERNLGTALIDFGGGTTDMAVFQGAQSSIPRCLPLAVTT